MAITAFNLSGGKLKIKNVIFGAFRSGNWSGTVNGAIPVNGTLIMVRIFTHGNWKYETLTVGDQAVPQWSTTLNGYDFSDTGWWFYAFQPAKVKVGDKFTLNRPYGTGSSVTKNGLYIGIIV